MLRLILLGILPLVDAFDLVKDIFTLIIVVVIVAVIASIALVGFLLVYGAEKSNPRSKREKNVQWNPAGRFCSYCGSQNERDAFFCKKCGKKLS